MFGWMGAKHARPMLAACILLAVVFFATSLILRFATVVETEVETTAVSDADQFSEAGAGPPADTFDATGPGRAHQVTTGEGRGGSSPASTEFDVPRRAWAHTAKLSIHSSNPDDLTDVRPNTQPAPAANTDDASRALTAPADSNPHKPTNHDVAIVGPTSHSGIGVTGSDADADDAADGTSIQDERSHRHLDSSGGGSFAARLHRRVSGIADAPAIGIAVGGTRGPAPEAHDRHEESSSGDVWRGISRAQTNFGPSLAGFTPDPPEGLRWRKSQVPNPNGKRPWPETESDSSPGNAALRSLVPQAANDATGVPTISGVAQVGHELTASTAGISDMDGNTKAEAGDAGYAYAYQWVRVDGMSESDISGATSKTYTVVADDAGKTLKVKVSFVDDAGNDEGPLTSAATATVVVPVVTIVADAASALYRVDHVTFTLTRTESTANALTVRVVLTRDQPFLTNNLRRDVRFAAGSATATLRLRYWDFLFAVGKVIQNGTLTASVSERAHYDVGTPASATTNIIIPVTFALALSHGTVSEESGDNVVVTLTVRTGEGAPAPSEFISLSMGTLADTAESPVDYLPTSRIYAIRSDDFTKDGSVYKLERTFEIPILNDNIPDSGETFKFAIEPGPGHATKYWNNFVDSEGKRCSGCRFEVTITDDDPDQMYIETLEIVSSPADNVYYEPGETVTVEATYMEPVTVTPSGTAPTLDLTIGENTRAAAYTGTSGDGKTLTFSYTVVSQDHDQDGISGDGGSIALNGGTIVEQATSDAANLRLPVILPVSEQAVNKDPEIVSRGVDITSRPVAHDTYGAGETIRITVTFNFPVAVSGTPRLPFNMGPYDFDLREYVGREEYLTHVRGSGTRTLVFEYVVQPDDMSDEGGIGVDRDAMQTNVGMIQQPITGRDAILTHGLGAFFWDSHRHKVDGSLMPTIAGLTGLRLSDATLSPAFAPGTTRYTASVAYAVASTTVTATAATRTDVAILPADSDTAKDGHQVDLEEGYNEIIVTASETGRASRTYTVAVTRAPEVASNATGVPEIYGRVMVGQWLFVGRTGISDPDGKTKADRTVAGHEYTYQWMRVDGANETDISGATRNTYRPVAADVGKPLKVRVTFVDDAGNPEGPLTSAATAAVAAAGNATGAPTISGVAQLGQVLTASTAGISDANGKTQAEAGVEGYAYTYRWVRVDGGSESDISGATSKTYTTVAADWGKTLKVRVTFVDDAGNPEGPLTSAATAAVAAAGNATGEPTISGRAQVGQVLTASTAGISDANGKTQAEAGVEGYAYTYRWVRVDGGSESDISGATSKTYTPVAEDVGKSLKVRVSFGDDAGNPEGPLISAATAPVVATGTTRSASTAATGAPTISGRAQVGQELTVLTDGISDADGKTRAENGDTGYAYAYRWARVDGVDESAITGATEATYTPVEKDEGKSLKVRISFVDDAGNPEGPLTSAATVAVKAANNPATGAPTISGRAQVGQMLAASTADITDADGKTKAENGDPGYAYAYQWVRVGSGAESDIAGATSETYTAAAADEGKSLKVKVSFVDDADNPEGPLSSEATATVLGVVPALSVLDAEVEERANAVMAFPVRLDRVASKLVTVRYATADGTAVAGFDYAAATGLLTFALGETQKTVSVPVHDDAHVEGDETLTLTLSGASGAQIADGLATGTILANSDPIPKAWLVRFGRTVAHQILDAVDERLATTPRRGIHVHIAGKRFSVASPRQAADEEEEPAGRPGGSANWLRGEDDGSGALRFDSQNVTTADLFKGNSISLTKATREGGFISLWSEGALSHFSGREDELRLGGEVASAMVGAGWTDGARAAGLVISHSRGEGTYRAAQRSHDIEGTLTGVFPYGRYSINERLSLWGVAGYGRGTQAFAPEGTETVESDFDMTMAAAGIRGELLTPAENDGLEIALKSDAMVVNTVTEPLPGAPSGVGGYVTRFGLGLQGRWQSGDEDGGLPAPVFEVGGRYDGGDAETGFGVDFGGGLSWTNRDLGLEAELRARALVSLDDKDFRERGVAGSLSWDPDPHSDLGPSLSLSQTVGASATGGAEALLGRDTLAGLAADDGESLDPQFEARLGYGHPVLSGRFTGTTELGLRLADKSREYALGWRLLPVSLEHDALELLLEGSRRESTEEEREPEHQVRVDLINRW